MRGEDKRTDRRSLGEELRLSRRLEVGPRKSEDGGEDGGIRWGTIGMHFQCQEAEGAEGACRGIRWNLGHMNVSLCPPMDGERMEAGLPLVVGPCFQLRPRDENVCSGQMLLPMRE